VIGQFSFQRRRIAIHRVQARTQGRRDRAPENPLCILAPREFARACSPEGISMWIKVVIVLLFIALVVSLFSGYMFLMKDKGSTYRTWNSLTVRLILAALLMGFLIYGVYTGQLGSKAPWDAELGAPTAPPQN
jgi:hypothetical protein